MDRIKILIEQARKADHNYMQVCMSTTADRAAEARCWSAKIHSRRELRQVIYEELGVTVDELEQLCIA